MEVMKFHGLDQLCHSSSTPDGTGGVKSEATRLRPHFQLPSICGFDLKGENESMIYLLGNGPKTVDYEGRACAD